MDPRLQVRSVAVAILAGSAVACLAGDPVIFSKPSESIASPREERTLNIPGRSTDIRNFHFERPQADIPYIPAPANRSEPKKTERKTVFDEPDVFADPDAARKKNDDPHAVQTEKQHVLDAINKQQPEAKRPGFPLSDPFRRSEQESALSPIRQFDWRPVPGDEKKDSKDPARNAIVTLWNRPENKDLGEEKNRPGMFSSLFNNPVKRERELSREQLERRQDFEKLLNPGFSPLGSRDPMALTANESTLQSLQSVKPPAPALTPVPVPVPERRSFDPMQAHHDQQRSWRGPTIDDLNRKAFGDSKASVSQNVPASGSLPARKPLMQQPTFPEFPGRPF